MNIPITAEGLLIKHLNSHDEFYTDNHIEAMKEFAKAHVKAALEAATNNLQASQNKEYNEKLKQSILNAYPDNLIK